MPDNLIYLMVDLLPHTAYWRGIIMGAGRYCSEHSELRLRLPSSEWELIGDGEQVDGVIAVVREPETFAKARRFGKPVVNVSSTAESVPFPTISIDNHAAGRMAADHLLSEGYRHFAYHMYSGVHFAQQRLVGFRERLSEAGYTCAIFDTCYLVRSDSSPAALRRDTIEWLSGLPKPVGLFAHNDSRASILLDICREAGLTVPEQVGVLGIDNDELLSTTSDPTLSSIDPAADLIGYKAAALVIDLIRGGEPPAVPVRVPPRRLVPRQSTKPVFLDDELLAKAVTHIRQHATDPLTIEDLLEEIPLSRRSLERRFRDRLSRSPGDEIRRVQMEKAKWLLIETHHTLTKVAATVGFNQFRNFATAFRREFGMSPNTYRKTFRMR